MTMPKLKEVTIEYDLMTKEEVSLEYVEIKLAQRSLLDYLHHFHIFIGLILAL